ncbi:MAG: toxin-antitoxin system YwqK family antitoxin, partial [Flavobacteriales bacterium]
VKAYTSTDFSPKYSMMKAPLIAFKTCVFLAIFAFTSMDIGNHEQYHFADGSPEASGAWYGGLEHGKWIYFHENGEPYTVMNYYKGKEEGAVNQFYDTGELYATGTYTNGLEDGPWMFYDEMGQLFYSSNYSLGRETGEKIILHSNGQFLEHGDMNRDLQVGEWEYKYENGQTEKKGEFKDGIPHGVWTFYYPNGAISHETNAVSETKEKILTVYDTDGELLVDNGFGWCTLYDQYWYKLVEGQVENGDRVGEWTWYHSNGNKKVLGEYKNEEFRIISCWNSNGEQTVSGGDGNFSDIDVNSGLFEKGVYENGKRTGVWESFFPESDLVYIQQTYFNGKLKGTSKSFHENGEVETEGRMLDLHKDGRWTWYYDTGQKESEVFYNKGLKSGVQQFWNFRGLLVKEENYIDGELESEQLF